LILADTSVWVDHLRRGDDDLADALERGMVLMHLFVIGEIACGSLADRASVLELLHDLPQAKIASSDEVLAFIERNRLHGKGIGYVDVHLLASTALSHDAKLWTHDKRLHAAAVGLGLAHAAADSH
jgi:predicted nucleic acid-binding protein